MAQVGIKDEARKLVDDLSDDATWEELEYKIHVRRKIESGLKSLEDGEALSTDEIRDRFRTATK